MNGKYRKLSLRLIADTRLLFKCPPLFFFFITLIAAGALPHIASADFVTYQKEYSYQAGEADSKISCRTISLEQVKSLLLEELGTYLERNTEIVNYEVTRDQIIALAAGIVRAQIITEKWDGHTYYILAKIQVDPKALEKSIAGLKEERQNISELEESKKRTNELLQEVEKLKQELRTATDGREKEKGKKQYDALTKELNAVDWFEKGYSMVAARQYQDAIAALDKAIELNPKYARAYSLRGSSYTRTDKPQKGIDDCTTVLELMPDNAEAYINRGLAYYKSHYYDKGIRDINRSIEINPNIDKAYNIRGLCYLAGRAYPQAVEDFSTAIKINPRWGYPYSNRCRAYQMSGKTDIDIRDCEKAIEINPYIQEFYVNRGGAFLNLKRYDEALNDLNKAVDMDLKYMRSYFLRGLVFFNKDKYQKAVDDLTVYIGSNPSSSHAYYFRALSYEKLNRKDELIADMRASAKLGNPRAVQFLMMKKHR